MKERSPEDFIKQANEKHGDTFDYSLVNYTGYKNNITVICNKHGSLSCKPRDHIRSKYGCCSQCQIEDHVNRTKQNVQNTLDRRFTGLIVWCDSDLYTNEMNNFYCKIHGHFKAYYKKLRYNNCGCPSCALDKIKAPRPNRKLSKNNGAINWSKLDRDNTLANMKAWLYVINIKTDSEDFYKVGVSNEDSFYFRMRRFAKVGDTALIQLFKGCMEDCYELEQLLLETADRYVPKVIFEGKTECFQSGILDELRPLEMAFKRVNKYVGGKPTQHYAGEITNELSNTR